MNCHSSPEEEVSASWHFLYGSPGAKGQKNSLGFEPQPPDVKACDGKHVGAFPFQCIDLIQPCGSFLPKSCADMSALAALIHNSMLLFIFVTFLNIEF